MCSLNRVVCVCDGVGAGGGGWVGGGSLGRKEAGGLVYTTTDRETPNKSVDDAALRYYDDVTDRCTMDG